MTITIMSSRGSPKLVTNLNVGVYYLFSDLVRGYVSNAVTVVGLVQ